MNSKSFTWQSCESNLLLFQVFCAKLLEKHPPWDVRGSAFFLKRLLRGMKEVQEQITRT